MGVARLKTKFSTDAGIEGGCNLPPVEKVARLNDKQARLKGVINQR